MVNLVHQVTMVVRAYKDRQDFLVRMEFVEELVLLDSMVPLVRQAQLVFQDPLVKLVLPELVVSEAYLELREGKVSLDNQDLLALLDSQVVLEQMVFQDLRD